MVISVPGHVRVVVVMALLVGLMGGCAAPEKLRGELRFGVGSSPDGAQIEFPSPPDVPRYSYAGELLGEHNFIYDRAKQTAWQKVFDLLTGLSDHPAPLELARPQAVVTDALGRVYVSDAGLAAVFVFDPVDGEPRVLNFAEGFVRFTSPSGMAVLPDGTLLVADAAAGFVARVDARGNTYPAIGRGILKRPAGVVFDGERKRIIVADVDESNLKLFDLSGGFLGAIGSPGSALGEFNRPTYLAIWKNELYVSDTLNARIQSFDLLNGAPIRSFGERGSYVGQLSLPKGIALDSDGNLYVVESKHDHLLIYDRAGRFLLPIGGTGYSSGKFYLPAGVWVDAGNRVFVADMYNGRVATYLYLGADAESSN